jgi:hypothetical protein
MKITQVDKMYTENTTPTPDEAGERVRQFLQQHKAANKGKPGFGGKGVSPEDHERNLAQRDHDRAEQQQRDDRATAFEESLLNEISNEVLGKYKAAAGKQASDADKKGDTATANKRFKGIVKATNKEFDNDKKKVAEGRVDSPVSTAIRNRIINQHPGLLKYGPDAVMAAIDWVANDVGQVEEIGSSDVSAWVQLVARYLYSSTGIAEGSAQWINRSAPAQDVSYEKTLGPTTDTWKGDKVTVTEISKGAEQKWAAGANKWRNEQTAKGGGSDPKIVDKADRRAERTMKIKNKHATKQINELGVDTLKNYSSNVEKMDPATTPKFKMVKHAEGHARANHKIAQKTGDRSSKMYESMLADIMEAFDSNAYADILNKQDAEVQAAKPKAKVVDIEFHGWTIKYRNSTPSEWMILDKKGEVKKKGESPTPKDAVADAEGFIKGGGGTNNQASKNVTIDFNVDFAKEFAPDGETFYANIDKDEGAPMLIFSTMPDKSLKRSHIRTQANKVTSGTTRLPMISMSPAESNKMGLQPNGRYTLGDKITVDDNTAMFPLIYQGTVQGKGDMMKLGRPGLTVAHTRD